MKKLSVIAALCTFLSIPAMAADLGVAPAPMAAPVLTWSGTFFGIHGGGSWTTRSISYSDAFTLPGNNYTICPGAPPAAVGLNNTCGRTNSVLFGGQIGYNWQSGAIVYSLVADASWRQDKQSSVVMFGTNTTAGAPFGSVATDTAYIQAQQEGLFTVRGRLGYAYESALFYATGGLAFGSAYLRTNEILAPGTTCGAGNCRAAVSTQEINVGWTVGAGIEWKLTPNWSVGAEYLYVDLGKSDLVIPASTVGFPFSTSTTTANNRSSIGRLTLNYQY